MNQHTQGPWWIMGREIDRMKVVIAADPFYPDHPDPLYHVSVTGENAEADAAAICCIPLMLKLADRIANLNENAGEIGAGMLNQLITEARTIIQLANDYKGD